MRDKIKLSDRMKGYEKQTTSQKFVGDLPVIIRLDGRAFHSFTRQLCKPFDKWFEKSMIEVTKYLIKETGAIIGYVQSDEISLVLYCYDDMAQMYFNGKVFKILSVLPSMAAAKLTRLTANHPVVEKRLPAFDCRAFQVISRIEVVNYLRWRESDAVKNSISSLAQQHFSSKQLHKKNSADKIAMLKNVGVIWEDLLPHNRAGSYLKKQLFVKKLSNPTLLYNKTSVMRSRIEVLPNRLLSINRKFYDNDYGLEMIFGDK